MCVGVGFTPALAEGDEDDDFERFHNALDLTAYFAGPYELQDVDDDAADNTEPVQAAVIETAVGSIAVGVGAVFLGVVEVFANKTQISKLSVARAKEECVCCGLSAEGYKWGCIKASAYHLHDGVALQYVKLNVIRTTYYVNYSFALENKSLFGILNDKINLAYKALLHK